MKPSYVRTSYGYAWFFSREMPEPSKFCRGGLPQQIQCCSHCCAKWLDHETFTEPVLRLASTTCASPQPIGSHASGQIQHLPQLYRNTFSHRTGLQCRTGGKSQVHCLHVFSFSQNTWSYYRAAVYDQQHMSATPPSHCRHAAYGTRARRYRACHQPAHELATNLPLRWTLHCSSRDPLGSHGQQRHCSHTQTSPRPHKAGSPAPARLTIHSSRCLPSL